MTKRKPTVICIFSGAGGIDIGFEKAGFRIIYSTDYWEPACNSMKKNKISNLVECKDIRDVDFKAILKKNKLNEIDCVIGGPPCPAYSKSRFYLTQKKRALDDENAFTLFEYFRAIKELKPKVFFFENVHGFVFKPHLAAFNFLMEESEKLGYEITYKVVNAANYGVPQIRERFICVGVKKGQRKFNFPDETHFNPDKKGTLNTFTGKKSWVTCKDVIGDLDVILPEDKNMQAGSKHKNLLKQIPPGQNYLFFTKERGHPNPKFKWRSRYWSFLLKLSPEKPSWTIQASHSNNMGPFHWKNRFLRIAEIKRLQTFPDDYQFVGDYRTQWRQIGNAVPPLLVQKISEAIKVQLFSN